MIQTLRVSLVLFAAYTLLLGFAYPGIVTAAAQAFFPKQANGSLIIEADGKVSGSELVGQAFSDPRYFWGRLSATGPVPYNAAASSGSNLGVNAPSLHDSVKARIETLKATDPGNTNPVPVDLATASGSGLDPHISAEAAFYQTARVANQRSMSQEDVKKLIEENTEKRQFGIFGQDRVNVLLLNRALDNQTSP
jgi:K+-transporting ATPase ATPase C chain